MPNGDDHDKIITMEANQKELIKKVNRLIEKVDEMPESLRNKMGEYFDNSISQKLRDEGGNLFADKETEKTVKSLKSSMFKWGFGVIVILLGTVVFLARIVLQIN